MTKRQICKHIARATVLTGLLVSWPIGAQAATSNPNTGISLSPFEENISIQPTDAAKTFNLTLTNHTTTLQELDLSAHDFGSLNDTGGVLLEGSNSYTQQYGLVSWLSLGTDTVILRPGESQSVPVTIDNRGSLQPGGHYGAVVASVNSLNDQSGNHVVINQQLLSLILVDKVGGDHYNLKLDSVSQNGNWLHLPNDIVLRFQNPGNVHVVPRGLVKLVSPGGRVVAQGIINSESDFILPESYRQIYVPLTPVAKALPLPGLYHLEVQYRYDGISVYATKNVAVRFINLELGISIVLVIIVGGRWWFRRKARHKKVT